MNFVSVIVIVYNGFFIKMDVEFLNGLLNCGGIIGMLDMLVVILFGFGFGGIFEKFGVLKVIVLIFEKKLIILGNVMFLMLIVVFLGNIFGCVMYVLLILMLKIMENSYDKLKFDRRILFWNVEVGGMFILGMVLWFDNGIYMVGIFGVFIFFYLLFMWFSFVFIGLVILYGYIGKFIWYMKEKFM